MRIVFVAAVTVLISFLACADPAYAERFHISACDYGTVVSISDAWPGASQASYLFVRRGDSIPSEGFDQIIRTPVRRVVSLSTTNLPNIEALSQVDRIVAVDSAAYIYSPAIRRRVDSGQIAEVGSAPGINIERIISLDPDLVILSVIAPDDPTVEQLRRAGIPVLTNADWREGTPLGRAEWIKVLGLAFGRLDAANQIFAQRAREYEELVQTVESVNDRPTVLVNAPYRGTWAVPEGDSFLSRLIEDAGGRYLWRDIPGSETLFFDIEQVMAVGAQADVWINLGYGWRSRADAAAADPRFAALKAFRENSMYHYNNRVNASGGNDYWESGAARPDLLLADLISIFHPDIMRDYRRVYYRRLDP